MRHTHTSIVSRHIATRGNNKIQRTASPHISSSEETFPRLTRRTLDHMETLSIQLFHCPNYIYIYIYSIFVFYFHMIENVSLAYLILININLEVSISDVIYIS